MNESNTAANNEPNRIIDFTVSIVSSALNNLQQATSADAISDLIKSTYSTLSGLGGDTPAPVVEIKQEPAVPVRNSVKKDFIVCLEDGKKMKMLKRYLANNFNLSPDEYRAKWNLPADYPMVAPNYSEKRRELAQSIGLGRQGRGGGRKSVTAEAADKAVAAKPARRKKAVAA